ncbi:binding domain-containing protein [Diaporthe amygdali]|uniref:binding domain-containing protein n=1 Tax=Phomopsis amygdali TaxID=1214568 RepID=UPI0022FDF0F7|nr:binding domain-containing protein [Diaporthe amygdali]KAJ0114545.1 binding domain-containing protein [Diaporthe amygdali]
MSTDASLRTFFSSKNFAVVGASSNTAKFGHKIFAWYLHHDIQAIPINPAAPSIAVPSLPDAAGKPSEIPTVKSLSALPDPKETSVSIITPPPVTLKVLEEAKKLGIPAVFLQPGTFDDEVLKYAREGEGEDAGAQADGQGFKAVVAGFGGGTVGSEGWCVLVDGERGLKTAGKL